MKQYYSYTGVEKVYGLFGKTRQAYAVDAYNTLRPHRSISNLTLRKAHTNRQKVHKTWKAKTKVKL